jgi:DNA invertase Pin-like site-specific DNA recombinase
MPNEKSELLAPAAMYVRMSTEHQQYSAENQADAIKYYAAANGFEIGKAFQDSGKSGLSIAGRNALKNLIKMVESGEAEFKAILVYDISRWGRFQDVDESAYYEYICRRAGISVHYCAEQFKNDNSTAANIMKTIKRGMAAEYSRELSSKVFIGQCRLIQLGYRQGGMAGYGLRRMLVDATGNEKGVLSHGEQKSIQTDRVVLAPGPPEEVETVRWIYHAFVKENKTEAEIADILNSKGLLTDLSRPWTRGVVHQVLTNEKYIGNNIFNRLSFKLKQRRVKNPPEMWIRKDNAFEGIVEGDLFYQVRGILFERGRRYSDSELLDKLAALYKNHGYISGILIDEAEGMPCSCVYHDRFGGLIRAYKLVGYSPETDYAYIEINKRLRQKLADHVSQVIETLRTQGISVEVDEKSGLMLVNREVHVSLVLSRCKTTAGGSLRWIIRLEQSLNPDITIAVRMDESNEHILDYYLLPRLGIRMDKLRLAEENPIYLDVYRFEDLSFFYELLERVAIVYAA